MGRGGGSVGGVGGREGESRAVPSTHIERAALCFASSLAHARPTAGCDRSVTGGTLRSMIECHRGLLCVTQRLAREVSRTMAGFL